MCGRYTLATAATVLAEHFQLSEVPDLKPRYNISPTQDVPAIRIIIQDKERKLHLFRWGLIPFWAKDLSIGQRMINARSETVEEKPAFRRAFKNKRCLVLADGFYEWQKRGKHKQPYLFRLKHHHPFAIAGLWERWETPEGEIVESCTLLTTEANECVAEIHNRMPVIIHPKDYDLWLNPQESDTQKLRRLLRPFPAAEMIAYPVSAQVNSPNIDSPHLIEPLPKP